MSKKAIGLTTTGIEIAPWTSDTAPDEGSYLSLGYTYKDTAIFQSEDGQNVPCECEELDDPEDEEYIGGKTTLKFSTSNLDPGSCHKVFGGTLSEDKSQWEAPASFRPQEVAVRFTTKTGLKVELTRAKMFTRINWAIKKDGYGLLEHTLTVLAPKDGGSKMILTDTTIASLP